VHRSRAARVAIAADRVGVRRRRAEPVADPRRDLDRLGAEAGDEDRRQLGRTSASGQRSPRMCSLSASPLPTPRLKRPSCSRLLVAAAWAMIAGWIRTVGHVTPVVTGSDVAWASAPITDQTKPLWPCSSFHGWKWSEIHSAWKPACSARLACSMSSAGVYSSLARK
jgi:hypothetical protein